jgi:SAM-dependent methyltransferase
MPEPAGCAICGAATVAVGVKHGRYRGTDFHLRRCPRCQFAYIADPWTDYAAIYSHDYYTGKGADPLVDYGFELEQPERTVRRYEWRGILRMVESLVSVTDATAWLDFGAGNGGLVRYVADRRPCEIVGFDEGWISEEAARQGIPFVDAAELETATGRYDVITAIEVLEHVVDPLGTLRDLHRLLKPGGLLLATTGNAEPHRDHLLTWSYVTPEIHVSFFEPETLVRALEQSGFRAERRGYLPGATDVIAFKVLKNLGVRRGGILRRVLPWSILARLVDRRYRVTAHPVGWAATDGSGEPDTTSGL